MTIRVDIQRASEEPGQPPGRLLREWVARAVTGGDNNGQLTIRIVDEEESAALNERWRRKKGPTNVLSFPYDGDKQLAAGLLGDIVICASVVRREAEEQHKDTAAHWAHMVIHGMLHLQGYDHLVAEEAEEMESLEIRLLESLGYTNPYLEIQVSQ